MNKTVLVTGGAGYIGSHTVVELLNAGYEVLIADNLMNSKIAVLDRIETITGKRPGFALVNVCDKEAMRKLFRENDFGAIIHFAGLKAVGESVAKPVEYYRNNLDANLTLLECMKEFDVRHIVFSSSATVYGIPKVPIKEDAPRWCTNPYGWTKFMGEQIFSDFAAANPEMSVVLLRYFNPIGAHDSGTIGEDPQGIPNNLLPYINQVATGKLKKLRGSCEREIFIHIFFSKKNASKPVCDAWCKVDVAVADAAKALSENRIVDNRFTCTFVEI